MCLWGLDSSQSVDLCHGVQLWGFVGVSIYCWEKLFGDGGNSSKFLQLLHTEYSQLKIWSWKPQFWRTFRLFRFPGYCEHGWARSASGPLCCFNHISLLVPWDSGREITRRESAYRSSRCGTGRTLPKETKNWTTKGPSNLTSGQCLEGRRRLTWRHLLS